LGYRVILGREVPLATVKRSKQKEVKFITHKISFRGGGDYRGIGVLRYRLFSGMGCFLDMGCF
jgi:hypothetical protein